ncbi:MAG TPA: PP2C family protein-serine/threonine phosphatase [Acidimicrobiales bacterium]|nr:PP2C family protein-serine/threonine phosphatase [Acidimicrobiales bacterium]
MNPSFLLVVAAACVLAAYVWGRSAVRLDRAARRIASEAAATGSGLEAARLIRSAFRKSVHTTLLYAILAGGIAVSSIAEDYWFDLPLALLLVPVVFSLRSWRSFLAEAPLAEALATAERRATEILKQEQSAPLAWAARLAPPTLPEIEGFNVGQVYEPGTGAMAGDFFDLYQTSPTRLAAVIGDVAGHGIEPSITAFQVKYLLRVFLRQYRDPAQAIEELNIVLSQSGRPEELVSLCAVVFDTAASTLRFASAGHPAAWLWHDGEVRPLRATGPVLTLDPKGTYTSREVPLDPGDLLLMYTDGLAEARQGEQLFGEERIGAILRRDPGESVTNLCKALLEAARDFATEPLSDDVAILAIRRI